MDPLALKVHEKDGENVTFMVTFLSPFIHNIWASVTYACFLKDKVS